MQPPDAPAVVDAVLAPEGAITYITIDPDGFASQEGVNDSNPIQGELVTCRLGRRRVRGPGDVRPGLRGADPGPLAVTRS